jgi:hypothetical protein
MKQNTTGNEVQTSRMWRRPDVGRKCYWGLILLGVNPAGSWVSCGYSSKEHPKLEIKMYTSTV